MEYLENSLSRADYCRLRQGVGWSGFSQDRAQRALDGSLFTLCGVEKGETVAMTRVIGDGIYFLLVDVVVLPNHQRQGIGRELVRRVLKWARAVVPEGGKATIQLIAAPGKESFYEKLGFCSLPGKTDRGVGMVYRIE